MSFTILFHNLNSTQTAGAFSAQTILYGIAGGVTASALSANPVAGVTLGILGGALRGTGAVLAANLLADLGQKIVFYGGFLIIISIITTFAMPAILSALGLALAPEVINIIGYVFLGFAAIEAIVHAYLLSQEISRAHVLDASLLSSPIDSD